jgi:hypothetical protein
MELEIHQLDLRYQDLRRRDPKRERRDQPGVIEEVWNCLSMITSMEPFRDRFIGATLGSV